MVLLWGGSRALGSGALLEEICPWGWALRVDSLTLLPGALSFLCVAEMASFDWLLLLTLRPSLTVWMTAFWSCKPKEMLPYVSIGHGVLAQQQQQQSHPGNL